ncbi:MAG: MOP flippase family protein [Desulfotomaculum sp.]|nr:MOP flippase family protein [Desulfotomaculum sp.]
MGVITAISTALIGQGVFALVWGALANAAARTLFLLVVGLKNWRPAWRFKISDIRSFVSFGLYQLGERTINFLNSKLDTILIGSLLGAQALGFYTLAWNLIIQPLQKLNPIITRVAFPVFAKLQDDNARLKRGYMSTLNILSAMNFPYFFGLAVVAPLLVPVVFGMQWLPSILLMQILCVVGLLRSTGNPIGSLLLAKGRADWGFKWNLAFRYQQSMPGQLLAKLPVWP